MPFDPEFLQVWLGKFVAGEVLGVTFCSCDMNYVVLFLEVCFWWLVVLTVANVLFRMLTTTRARRWTLFHVTVLG